MTKPVIAKVRGYALGGGFELALACDIIVAAEDASFALPEARLGLIPGAGGAFRLLRQLPPRTALGYLMTGRHMSAKRAFELGLINETVPTEDLDACVEGWVQDLLRCAPLSIRAIKEVSQKSATVPLEEAFAMRYVWEEARRTSSDAVEGPKAFAAKRTPIWQGR
jgi:enoyl-CoA hydratase/carnithine racemase